MSDSAIIWWPNVSSSLNVKTFAVCGNSLCPSKLSSYLLDPLVLFAAVARSTSYFKPSPRRCVMLSFKCRLHTDMDDNRFPQIGHLMCWRRCLVFMWWSKIGLRLYHFPHVQHQTRLGVTSFFEYFPRLTPLRDPMTLVIDKNLAFCLFKQQIFEKSNLELITIQRYSIKYLYRLITICQQWIFEKLSNFS